MSTSTSAQEPCAPSASTSAAHDEVDRNLAILSYVLLFFAIFFAGAPALIAVAIAYARRRDAEALARSHFRFQILIFWIGFALTLLAALSGLVAVFSMLGDIIKTAIHGGWDSWDMVSFETQDIRVDGWVIAAAVGTVFMGALTALWLIVTSAYGFIMLASNRSLGQTRPK